MSILDLHARAFDQQTLSAAAEISAAVNLARETTDLPIYTGAVAIDSATTKDRDDAIKIWEDEHHVTVETFIADPTRFMAPGDLVDVAARERLYTLYRKNGRSPAMPASLSEDTFSLNEGRITPAVRIATKLDKQSGAITSVTYERCWVDAENTSYEKVSKKIEEGDPRFADWSQKAKWLRERRQKNAKGDLLPSYDPESGIYRKEDGQITYVDPKIINSYTTVSEAMILTNHAIGLLMKSSFEYGLFRTQETTKSKSEYLDTPEMHISVGVDPYAHGSSPLRRYPDVIVHRFLSALGDKFELPLDGSKPITFAAPIDRDQLRELTDELNTYGKQLKDYYKVKREEEAAEWLEKNFPQENPEKFQAYKPDVFSDRLKVAAASGMMSEPFADEIKSRLKNKAKFGLVMPRDAVSILRHIRQKGNRENPLWTEIVDQMLERLAHDPSMLDKVFANVMDKTEFKDFHTRKTTFFTKPSDDPEERRRYSVAAAAVVATLGDKTYTSSQFYVSPSHNMAELRAKLEFLRDYAKITLKVGDNPKFPDADKTYLADGLHFEQSDAMRERLENAGYKVREVAEIVPSANTRTPREYQHILEISRDGKQEFDVIVTSAEPEEARKIALEVASQELIGRADEGLYEALGHTGATSFAARFPKRASHSGYKKIITEQKQVLPHPRTAIASKGACEALDDFIGTQGYSAKAYGASRVKKDLKITPGRSKDFSMEKIAGRIAELLPNTAIITRPGTSIVIENAPPLLMRLCEQREKKKIQDRFEKVEAIRAKKSNAHYPQPRSLNGRNGNGNNGHGQMR